MGCLVSQGQDNCRFLNERFLNLGTSSWELYECNRIEGIANNLRSGLAHC